MGGSAGPDPLNGKFSLADATKDISGTGPLTATIDTTMGKVSCRLYDDKAPNTVANFVGLATGKRNWVDPNTNTWVQRPAYDGTTFHRPGSSYQLTAGSSQLFWAGSTSVHTTGWSTMGWTSEESLTWYTFQVVSRASPL